MTSFKTTLQQSEKPYIVYSITQVFLLARKTKIIFKKPEIEVYTKNVT
jgi:hypothetical protein